MSVRITESMKGTLNKKCGTQEQPRKKNKIPIEESNNDDSEPLDNDSDESETECKMKTRSEDDEFMDMISTDVSFECG